ncbi:MAG: hypothetical protein AAB557_04970 [Patescibacteria group bacterium]
MEDQPAASPTPDLAYEETPVIEPITEELSPVPPEPPQVPPQEADLRLRHNAIGSSVGMIFFFLLLFAVGVGLSVFLRQYLGSRPETPTPQTVVSTPTPTVSPTPYVNELLSPTATPTAMIAVPSSLWKTYPVISGTTKLPIPRLTFTLPPEVLAPVCDGGSCASQGTYLPGGSRFTVAPRGRGQLLVDARGNVGLTDASGKSFTIKQVTLTGGRKALEYTGDFQGSTVGGYTFTKMHGFMIEIDEGITLEMNHFAPSGLTVDFAGDEALFDKVVVSVTSEKNPKITVTPTPIRVLTPTVTPAATLQPTP